MIKFVNAKINIGLYVTSKRKDGYHTLETVFYPVGLYAGSAGDPSEFCDILEITPDVSNPEIEYVFSGRKIDCDNENNLVVKAVKAFQSAVIEKGIDVSGVRVELNKHLPDGAGMGGGSADATFTLIALNEYYGEPFCRDELADIALSLGADCPFFLHNKCCFASGIGEEIEEMKGLNLDGNWIVLAKPDISISTREAFAGIKPTPASYDLRELSKLPKNEWKSRLGNDFEKHLFENYPELAEIKKLHYECGAWYAQMTGSGSVVYGLYSDYSVAKESFERLKQTIGYVSLLKL